MNKYSIRATEALWPTLIELGATLGVIRVNDETVTATQGAWDYIGPIYRSTGELDEEGRPLSNPIVNAEGEILLHANLKTPVNLRERAAQMAEDNPDIAQAMQSIGLFVLLDENGNARDPAMPHRVWFNT